MDDFEQFKLAQIAVWEALQGVYGQLKAAEALRVFAAVQSMTIGFLPGDKRSKALLEVFGCIAAMREAEVAGASARPEQIPAELLFDPVCDCLACRLLRQCVGDGEGGFVLKGAVFRDIGRTFGQLFCASGEHQTAAAAAFSEGAIEGFDLIKQSAQGVAAKPH